MRGQAMGAGGGGGGGADRGVNRGAGGLEGVAAGGGGGATGNGGGAAPLRSRVARAGGSCFVDDCTFSFPIVCWAAIVGRSGSSGSQLFESVPKILEGHNASRTRSAWRSLSQPFFLNRLS